MIRSTNTKSHKTSYSDKGKGKARAYDFQGDEAEEHEGLLAVDHGGQANGRHEVIQMNQLPPQWYVIVRKAILFAPDLIPYALRRCRIDEADRVDEILDRLKPKCKVTAFALYTASP